MKSAQPYSHGGGKKKRLCIPHALPLPLAFTKEDEENERPRQCKRGKYAQRDKRGQGHDVGKRDIGPARRKNRREHEHRRVIEEVRDRPRQNTARTQGEKREAHTADELINRLFGIVVKQRKERTGNEHGCNRPPPALRHLAGKDPAEHRFFQDSGQHRDDKQGGQNIPTAERRQRHALHLVPEQPQKVGKIAVKSGQRKHEPELKPDGDQIKIPLTASISTLHGNLAPCEKHGGRARQAQLRQ